MKTFVGFLNEGRGRDVVTAFASKQHEVWRKGFDPENTGKERIKKNSDGSEGNINVPFNKLHPDWQKENLAAGKAALQAVRKHPNDMESAAEHVHKEWMKRNPKADYNAAQHVPYNELPDEEKQKDRDHVNTMKSLLGRRNTNEEVTIHDATGKTMKIKNVQFRGVDGKLHSLPPGKSRSSER